MTDLMIVGIVLVGCAIIGGSLVLSEKVRANVVADRARLEERYEKRIAEVRKEADSWRMAFEEQRIKNTQLQSRLDIQNMIYGKVKVKELHK